MKPETPAGRLRLALDMFKLGVSMKEAQLRRENPRHDAVREVRRSAQFEKPSGRQLLARIRNRNPR